ncbi:hypothetical protein FJ872_09690 [Mesorhizobium sp. B2-5-9]|nr:hypothetical protein FJ872_09690 [Mesorhizobium sp. B2-5-9]TPK85184.1 hypothetical protein FJ936_12060 [Mesorhizobium sp. B2-4-13]
MARRFQLRSRYWQGPSTTLRQARGALCMLRYDIKCTRWLPYQYEALPPTSRRP